MARWGGSFTLAAISRGVRPLFIRRTVWSCTNWEVVRERNSEYQDNVRGDGDLDSVSVGRHCLPDFLLTMQGLGVLCTMKIMEINLFSRNTKQISGILGKAHYTKPAVE